MTKADEKESEVNQEPTEETDTDQVLEDTNVECPICGKILSDKKNLKKHADAVHLNIRKHHCTACGKRFSARNDLLDHVRAVHDKVPLIYYVSTFIKFIYSEKAAKFCEIFILLLTCTS